MSKTREFPHQQPFNVSPRHNLTKNRMRTWWGHSPFNNNSTQSKKS